ncbi:MAG: cytochrome c biogenesis protein CcsA [Gammaproteobacteria bacterium]|jgi:ABC-type uncharacterized transport system permease subunit
MMLLRFAVVVLYLLAAWLLVSLRFSDLDRDRMRSSAPAFMIGLSGLVLHGLLLYQTVMIPDGPDLGVSNVFSLVGMLIAMIGLLAAFAARFRGLCATLLPIAAVAALFTGVGEFSGELESLSWELKAHIAISVIAYTLLSIGAFIAVLIWFQDRALRSRRPESWVRLLPALETLEQTLFMTIHAGVALLTLSVFSGLIFVDNFFAQHLLHKAVLSIVALIVFGILLIGRWRMGWRGRKAIHWTLAGYGFLALAYFGSRLILEFVLGRQWG